MKIIDTIDCINCMVNVKNPYNLNNEHDNFVLVNFKLNSISNKPPIARMTNQLFSAVDDFDTSTNRYEGTISKE